MNKQFEEYKRMYDDLEELIVLDPNLKSEEVIALVLYMFKESSMAIDVLTSGETREKIIRWTRKRFS